MSLEAKMDDLIVALNKNTEALAAAKASGAVPSTDTGGKTTTRKTKDTPAAPTHNADAIKAKFESLKTTETTPQLKKIIADLGFTSLGELLTKPEKFDASMDALVAFEGTLGGAAADDDDL